jgi:hypothetical protein
LETTGAHDRGYLEDLHAWLRRDVDPDGPQESILLLLDAIAARSSSPFDRAGTAEALGYASKNTFDRRLARLVASYGALWCPQRNEKAGRFRAHKQSSTSPTPCSPGFQTFYVPVPNLQTSRD